ncbi:MAG: Cytochrome c biosis protein-like protein [Herbinix sp.]|jgi:hypothetical protein|nr:Cytochrome c biosis protein-like protein [Herbinix sp.]
MKFKRVVIVVFVLLLTACGRTQPSKNSKIDLPEKIEMYYFHEGICDSCDPTKEFDEIVNNELESVKHMYPYSIDRVSIYQSGGRSKFEKICDELGLSIDSLELPLLIVGGKTYQGNESIEKNILEAYLTTGEDIFERGYVYNPKNKKTGPGLFDDYKTSSENITLVYFYRVVCDECIQTKPIIDQLPKTVEINGEPINVDLIKINTRSGNNGDRITVLFDSYHVPDEERMVPIIFTSSGYYAGIERISKYLEDELSREENIGFTFPEVTD